MFCTNCGQKLEIQDNFCSRCGKAVRRAETTELEKPKILSKQVIEKSTKATDGLCPGIFNP